MVLLRRRRRRRCVPRRSYGFTFRVAIGKARTRCNRHAIACPCSSIAGRGSVGARGESVMRIYGARRQRVQGLHGASRNRHLRILVARRQRGACEHGVPIDRDHWDRPVSSGPIGRKRSSNGTIPDGREADIRAAVKAQSPPRPATAHARRPSPTEAIVEIPRSALVGHITPRVARRPQISIGRRIRPFAVPIGIEVGVRGFIR